MSKAKCKCGQCKSCQRAAAIRHGMREARLAEERLAQHNTVIEERGPTPYDRMLKELGPWMQRGSGF